MRIIIAGCGKLGSMLAGSLVNENHDVTVIDRDEDVLDRLSDLDVLPIKGNAVSVSTLEEADIKHADVLIAVTISDESNMLCCTIGKKLGAKYTIARIREPEYLKNMSFVTQELSINYVANPERATAREISRMLRLPFAVSGIETFVRGLVEMVEVRVNGDEPFVGAPLSEVYKTQKNMPRVLFCGISRDDEALIPKGDFVVKAGDSLFVTADYATITAFFKYIGKNAKAAKDALIIGGSRIAYYLCTILNESGVKTKLIEYNEEKARILDETLEKTTVICGDGTDQELLLSEGLKTADAFVALTDRDEENLMAGLYAAHAGDARVIVKNNRVNYSNLLSTFGMDSIISPTQIARNIIVRVVRAREAGEDSGVERMYKIMGGRAEALEFIVPAGAAYAGIPLAELNVDESSLIAVIVRGNRVIVPFGADTVEAGDHVVAITRRSGTLSLGDILEI
ncbi:MAG: Trk system potassium transporter TrkA [Clostridia bacterium]|nr:Trk system potassium transporter TrkA [Clostridia bacterium]